MLRAEQGARTADAQPAPAFARCKAVVFHEVQSDELIACSGMTIKAAGLHGNDASRIFGDAQELVDDALTRPFAVLEREVEVLEASTLENSCFWTLHAAEANDCADILVL